MNKKDQTITFCGVGAHHQNGIIENKNKMLTLGARTMLLHAMRLWPQMIDTMFWPFAMKAAAERHNYLSIDSSNASPASKLYGVELDKLPVKTYHTLFCPIYVLDARAQSAGGPGPPKWEPRSRIGVYLGHSSFHAGSVALVFNPRTGRVSPQYHVVFDDTFSTVPYMDAGTVPPNWPDLVKYSTELPPARTSISLRNGLQLSLNRKNRLICNVLGLTASPIHTPSCLISRRASRLMPSRGRPSKQRLLHLRRQLPREETSAHPLPCRRGRMLQLTLHAKLGRNSRGMKPEPSP